MGVGEGEGRGEGCLRDDFLAYWFRTTVPTCWQGIFLIPPAMAFEFLLSLPPPESHCPSQCKDPSRPVQTAVQTPSRPRPDTLIFCPDHSEAPLEMVKTQYKTATPTITASDQVVPFIKLKGNISYSWPPQPPADARHPRRPSLAFRRLPF